MARKRVTHPPRDEESGDGAILNLRVAETMKLSRRDSELLVDALLTPPPPSPRLREAVREYLREFGKGGE